MKKLLFSVFMSCAVLGGAHSSASAASPAESAALTKSVAKIRGDGAEAIGAMAAAGKAAGWTSPSAASGVGLSGTWNVTTSDGKSGRTTFGKNTISGALSDFKKYGYLTSSKGQPALVLLADNKYFVPFKKSGTIILVNLANHRQWFALRK